MLDGIYLATECMVVEQRTVLECEEQRQDASATFTLLFRTGAVGRRAGSEPRGQADAAGAAALPPTRPKWGAGVLPGVP